MKDKEWNDTIAREQMAELVESSHGNKFALICDLDHFSIDFVREWKDKVRWIFNCGPYSKEAEKEFNIEEDPYGFLREKYR